MVETIIEITGQPGSGKSSISDHLVETRGFSLFSVSGFIKKYADSKGLEIIERFDYETVHKEILSDLGRHAITDMILGSRSERIVVDGLRVPAYVKELNEHGGVNIALHSPAEQRYGRVMLKHNGIDSPPYEKFLRDEAREYRSKDPYACSTLSVMDAADYHVDATHPLDVVTSEVVSIVDTLIF
jgi:cytidylate kinase